MAELTREHVEALRAAGWPGIKDEVLGSLCDLALRALDAGQREAKLVEALRQHAFGLGLTIEEAREALREYESPPPQDLIATRPDASLIAERPSPASGGDLDAAMKP